MSEPTDEPTDAVTGQPIPFKTVPPDITGATQGNPPTSLADCIKTGGHGGPRGDRWYFRNNPQNTVDKTGKVSHSKLGELTGDTRVCMICGTVNI